jgi:maltose alpha-D-glucosyltransferase/alpha-amylase
VAGEIEYKFHDRRKCAVGILQDFVPNEGDAWRHTLDALSQYFDRAATGQASVPSEWFPAKSFVDLLCDESTPPPVGELIGPYYENVKILGRRTADLHIALAADHDEPDFAPEPFSVLYQRSLYQSMRNHAGHIFTLLRKRLTYLPSEVVDDALKVVDRSQDILNRFRSVLSRKIVAKRTRNHGDYHLGQVLYTGKDYIIIDFEGEPARPLTERRIKRSPVRDIAGMLRSFHYAAFTSLFGHLGSAMVRPEDRASLEPWARLWNIWIGAAFLKSYLEHAMPGGFLPTNGDEFKILLSIYLLEKALYELAYELNNRPDWVKIPLIGILQLLEEPTK